jgi:hypothetical protein
MFATYSKRIVAISVACLVGVNLCSTLIAQEDSGTLFRWNSSVEPKGGPPGWDEPLASDRPDFTEASCTVGRGVRQLEMGYTFFHDKEGEDSLQAHSYPEFLYRYGVLADWLELRVGWSYNSERLTVSGTSGTAHAADDLYLGAKLGLTPQQGWLPEMAIVPQMLVPVGGEFSAGRVLPGVNWLYGWDLTDFWSLGGTTQYNISVDEFTDKVHGEFAQGFTLGQSWHRRLGSYTEWFMLSPNGAETEVTEHYFNGGFIFRVSNNFQLDIRAGTGLSEQATDFFSGLGAVTRF